MKSKLLIILPLLVGGLSALLSGNMDLPNSPSITPPSVVFPIVWTILYLLMGISSYLIYESDSPDKETALRTYGIQLFFNFCWSIVFFRLGWYLFAFFWLLILIGLIIRMIYEFYQIKPIAAYLQIPYLLWCIFAAYLNYLVYLVN